MNTAVLIDGRNLFQAEAAREAGFEYAGIGRAVSRKTGNGSQSAKPVEVSAAD